MSNNQNRGKGIMRRETAGRKGLEYECGNEMLMKSKGEMGLSGGYKEESRGEREEGKGQLRK